MPGTSVVPGFSEALTMMQPGGCYEIILPSLIAYQYGQTLIFDVELINVQSRYHSFEPRREGRLPHLRDA